jgi:beta-lactamase regulating signal transducer with metallopeptidase domain
MPDLVTLATPMADRVLCWSAETILVGSALAIVAALACRASGRRLALGPAARHALWLVVLIRLMAPPLVHWPWSVPIASARAASAPDPARDFAARVELMRGGPEERDGALEAGVKLDLDTTPIEAPPARDPGPSKWSILSRIAKALGPWIAAAWLAGSMALGFGQARRIDRFRRRVREATPAPGWLVGEAEKVGLRLGVRVPEIRVLPGLGTPLLWCLGRPVLLVPDDLLESLDHGRWPAIVAHELAHLRRLDPWVRRLELLAGLVWWWNPLYWITRRRLDFEAELACDAWVLWALPDDRLTYAESLIQIGSSKSPAAAPAPSLGVAGSARSFERRLTMILGDRVACRVPAPGLLGAALLTLLALPSWTLAEPARGDDEPKGAVTTTRTVTADARIVDDDDDVAVVVVDDDDDDDDDDAKLAKEKAEKKAIAKEKAKAEKAKAKIVKDKAEAKGGKADAKKEVRIEMRLDDKDFGPDFEKRMEAFGKEMEAKFGPGSEFEKKMKAMGKEMEFKFGPGSKFEIEMKTLGEDMAKEFGPGSEFEKKMKAFEGLKGKAEEKVKEGAKDREKMAADAKAKAEDRVREVRVRAERATRARAEAASVRKARRIEMLEAQIKKMSEELKRLKAEDDEDEKG